MCFPDAEDDLGRPKCLGIKAFSSSGKIPAGKSLFGAFPTLCQHTESVARSVGVMVFVERIVPPAAVLLLFRKHDFPIVLIINRPVGFWQKCYTVHGIVMAVEVEISRIREMG